MRDNLRLKSFLLVLFVIGALSFGGRRLKAAAITGNLTDNYFMHPSDSWQPSNGKSATDRVYVTSAAYLPEGGNIDVEIYGGFINDIQMNNGCITLRSDLDLTGSLAYESSYSGTITTDNLVPKTLFLHKNQTLTNHITFTGNVILECMHSDVDLGTSGTIFVQSMLSGAASSLKIREAHLSGDNNSWLNLADANQTVTFDHVTFEKDPYSADLNGGFFIFEGDSNKFNGGITLPSEGMRFQSRYPVSGAFDFNGMTLTLDSDLVLAADSYMTGTATIFVDGDSNNRTIILNANQVFDELLSFSGDVTLNGNNYTIDFNNAGKITVASGKTVKLQNIRLNNLSADCFDQTAGGDLVLLDNVTLHYYGF